MGQRTKKIIILFILSVIFSCSQSVSENRVFESNFFLEGGKSGQAEWKTPLEFTRISWYSGVTMFYDLMLAPLDRTSPYMNWLSESNRKIAENCQKYYIGMRYNFSPLNLSHGHIGAQITGAGFEEINLVDFKNALRNHPYFEDWKLRTYRVNGYCLKENRAVNLELKVPNFTSVFVQL